MVHFHQITLYGPKSQLAQLQFAQRVTGLIVQKYEEFFNISYPLEKLGESRSGLTPRAS